MNFRLPDWLLALMIVALAGFTFGYVPHQWMLQLQQQAGNHSSLPWLYYLPYISGVLAILLSVVIWQSIVQFYLEPENRYRIRPSNDTIGMASVLISTIIFGIIPCVFIYHVHEKPVAREQSYLAFNGACFTSSTQAPISRGDKKIIHYAIQCGEPGNVRLFFIDPSDFEGSDSILRSPGSRFHCEISTTGKADCDAGTSPRSDP